MIRNPKALGLALAAVLAMSAVVASEASAQGVLTVEEPVTQTGTETGAANANQLSAFGLAIRCPGSTYTGHKYNATPHSFIPNGVSIATLTPLYKSTTETGAPNCSAVGLGWPETQHMNGCDYVVHLGATTGGAGTYAVTLDLVCPAGKEVTTTLWTSEALHTSEPNNPFCVLHIPEQFGLSGAHAINTSGGHIGIQGTLTGITVTKSASASHPVLCAEAKTHNATYSLDITVSGDNEAGEEIPMSLSD